MPNTNTLTYIYRGFTIKITITRFATYLDSDQAQYKYHYAYTCLDDTGRSLGGFMGDSLEKTIEAAKEQIEKISSWK